MMCAQILGSKCYLPLMEPELFRVPAYPEAD